MKKGTSPARESGLFSGLEMNGCSVSGVQVTPRDLKRKVAHGCRTRKSKAGLVDGIVNGERVLIATKPEPLEKGIEIQIRVAIGAAGHIVWKHTVEACHHCGKRPTKRTGLGEGASDLICIHKATGRFIGIEVKRPKYSPSDVRPRQRVWLETVRRWGGVTGIATSVEEALAIVELAGRTP